MSTNLYRVLGVAESATIDDIKKVYKQLALKYHPDKCTLSDAKERFQEIQVAYTVLTDRDKRQKHDKQVAASRQAEARASSAWKRYDKTVEPEGRRAANSDRSSSLVFNYCRYSNILDAEDSGSFEKFPRGSSGVKQSDSSRNVTYCVPLEVLYNGGRKFLNLPRTGPLAHQPARVEVIVSPGDKDGDIKYYKIPSGYQNRGPRGYDVSVTIREIRHKIFSRKNDNLHQKIKISHNAALRGFSISVPLMNDSTVNLEQGPGAVRTGTLVRLVGHGMPSKGDRGFGDMIVEFEVEAEETSSE